jgi:hypothetical protein
LFFQGNPIMAVGSLLRYYRTPDEDGRVSITQRLGHTKTRLSNYELIETLHDPSYNVRYEAIIAVANSRPDPELIDALILVLGGDEPDLTLNAAWALGKIGDKSAILALRETLLSDYALLRARSARALAELRDNESIPFILEQFRKETKPGLRIAYASALGKMRSPLAIEEMTAFLRTLDSKAMQQEMSLALARIVGSESDYISFWRKLQNDPETGIAQILLSLSKDADSLPGDNNRFIASAESCSSSFEIGDIEHGVAMLVTLIHLLLASDKLSKPLAVVLAECAQCLAEKGSSRREYILLALHAMNSAIKELSAS